MTHTAAPPVVLSEEPSLFSLLHHPAVVYAKKRLQNPKETAQLHTIHAFDFDQTLFRSPLPNPALWDPWLMGSLVSWNTCGSGWWHNSATLEFGSEAEASAWDGWWNEDLVTEIGVSTQDSGCLTVLLTGRNGPVYNEQLLRMLKAKGLDFDIVATKPATVALVDAGHDNAGPSSNLSFRTERNKVVKAPTVKGEIYRNIHTFSVKHDFLYHVLFEYHSIRHMRIWDDRMGQISKFRRAGQQWLDKRMLHTFEVTQVTIPHRFMDPEREKSLVLAMVEAHNRQVEIEAKGGPFLVSGVGFMPRTRPELQGSGIWEPFETYTPQRRARMEIVPLVQYTGVLFSEKIQSFLMGFALGSGSGSDIQQEASHAIRPPLALQQRDMTHWEVPDEVHVTLCLGAAPPEFLEAIGGMGASVLVEIETAGELDGRIWALKVKGVDPAVIGKDNRETWTIVAPSGECYPTLHSFIAAAQGVDTTVTQMRGRLALRKAGTPHITMAYDRSQGARPSVATKITQWDPVSGNGDASGPAKRVVLVGTIGEKRLLGVKTQKLGRLAVVPRAEVSIANLIKDRASEKNSPLSGRDLGQLIKAIQQEMDRLSIENKAANVKLITTLVHTAYDHTLDCVQ